MIVVKKSNIWWLYLIARRTEMANFSDNTTPDWQLMQFLWYKVYTASQSVRTFNKCFYLRNEIFYVCCLLFITILLVFLYVYIKIHLKLSSQANKKIVRNKKNLHPSGTDLKWYHSEFLKQFNFHFQIKYELEYLQTMQQPLQCISSTNKFP